ncbi:MAG: hypothetical protein JO112_20180 [Planctomycetes bacterium]|nr:hypothetical protein [Planctomycetota bacterium]
MSEDNTNEKKAREPKKNSIPSTEVKALVAGIPQYDKASFLVVGHKNGVRIALPKTTGVSRAYFYGNGDYTAIPEDEAITVFSEEERKQNRRGGIMAEVNFDLGVEAAKRALGKLVAVVKAAPAPKAKPKAEPKVKKEPKAQAEAPATEETEA